MNKKLKNLRKELNTTEILDVKKSILPKWLIEKGVGSCFYNLYDTLSSLKKELEEVETELTTSLKFKKSLSKKMSREEKKYFKRIFRIFDLEESSHRYKVKEYKEQIKNFYVTFFDALDVEKAFREVNKK